MATYNVLNNLVPVGTQQTFSQDSSTTGITGANIGIMHTLNFPIQGEAALLFHGYRNDTGAYNGEAAIATAYTVGSAILEVMDTDGTTVLSRWAGAGSGTVAVGGTLFVTFAGLPYMAAGSKVRVVYNVGISTTGTTYHYTNVTAASHGALYESFTSTVTNRATVADAGSIPSANGFSIFCPLFYAKPVGKVLTMSLHGDSLSDNTEYYDPRGPHTWGWLARAVYDSGKPISLINFATAASRVEENTNNGAKFVAFRMSLDQAERSVVFLGTNDLIAGDSASTIIAKIENFVRLLEQKGKDVWVCTLPPEQNTTTDEYIANCADENAARLAIRRSVNDWIRSTQKYIDISKLVSNSTAEEPDGAQWALPTAPVNASALSIAASPASTTTRFYWTTASDPNRIYRELYGDKFKFRANTTTAALQGATTEGTGSNVSGANNLSDVSAAVAATPATGDTFDIYEAYTRDGIHFAPGAVKAISSSTEVGKALAI